MRSRFWALVVVVSILASLRAEGASVRWLDTMTPHFDVRHEDAFLPPGLPLFLEKLHNRLRLDLSAFSPWMAKERIKLYLYANYQSYVAGEFNPPKWSNGVSYFDRKSVVVYDQPERRKLLEIIAHETTHLLFESYWGESKSRPPQWLNEGLAMLEETSSDADRDDRSDWQKSMAALPPNRLIPLKKLLILSPTRDLKDSETVQYWYVQSFSVVYFLARQHTRLQFQRFCHDLREGHDLSRALWDVYRIRGEAELDVKWRNWLRETYHAAPEVSRPGPRTSPEVSEADPGKFQRVDFGNYLYHSLREEPGKKPKDGSGNPAAAH